MKSINKNIIENNFTIMEVIMNKNSIICENNSFFKHMLDTKDPLILISFFYKKINKQKTKSKVFSKASFLFSVQPCLFCSDKEKRNKTFDNS